jgi:hypothetical protein
VTALSRRRSGDGWRRQVAVLLVTIVIALTALGFCVAYVIGA